MDIIFIVELCKELGREIKLPAIVFEDNGAVIALSREMTSRAKRCKHFLMIVNWIREFVEAGLIELRQIPDEANDADVLTKIVTGRSFKTKAGRLLQVNFVFLKIHHAPHFFLRRFQEHGCLVSKNLTLSLMMESWEDASAERRPFFGS